MGQICDPKTYIDISDPIKSRKRVENGLLLSLSHVTNKGFFQILLLMLSEFKRMDSSGE